MTEYLDIEERWPELFEPLTAVQRESVVQAFADAWHEGWVPNREDVENLTDEARGAIDAEAADKLADFLELAQAHGLPVISLCDTPGFMVGPEHERTATVRHFSRLFVIGSHLRVPVVTVVLLLVAAVYVGAFLSGNSHWITDRY